MTGISAVAPRWYAIATGVGSPGNQIRFADLNGEGKADYLDIDPTTGATQAWLN